MACPCGACHSLECCECCAWYDHPRTELERRGDLVEERWSVIQSLSAPEAERLADEYRARFAASQEHQ